MAAKDFFLTCIALTFAVAASNPSPGDQAKRPRKVCFFLNSAQLFYSILRALAPAVQTMWDTELLSSAAIATWLFILSLSLN
nr:hypothetical protein Iba_chr09bCG4540 [Ipomoea batatas]